MRSGFFPERIFHVWRNSLDLREIDVFLVATAMRYLLFALMILGLLTGGPLRAEGCSNSCQPPVSNDCCEGHGQEKGHPESQCPEGHHHHGMGCHVSPAMTAEDEEHLGLTAISHEGSSCRPQSEVIPEGPFLSSEKPPLI